MTESFTAVTPRMAPGTDAWTRLQEHCTEALSVSRKLLTRIESGAEAADLLPLLQQERDAVTGVQEEVARFSGQLPATGAPRRDEIAAQLAELMQLDGLSRDLLSRRGVRLRAVPRRGHRQRFAAARVPTQQKEV